MIRSNTMLVPWKCKFLIPQKKKTGRRERRERTSNGVVKRNTSNTAPLNRRIPNLRYGNAREDDNRGKYDLIYGHGNESHDNDASVRFDKTSNPQVRSQKGNFEPKRGEHIYRSIDILQL